MIRPVVHVHEIDHRPRQNPIDQVAGCAADDEREADARDQLMMREARGVHADADERGGRDDGNQHRLERKLRSIEDAERRARVLHVRDVDEAVHDRHADGQRQHLPDHPLGELIDGDDQNRQPHLEPPRRHRRDRILHLHHGFLSVAHAA